MDTDAPAADQAADPDQMRCAPTQDESPTPSEGLATDTVTPSDDPARRDRARPEVGAAAALADAGNAGKAADAANTPNDGADVDPALSGDPTVEHGATTGVAPQEAG
ncbi:MAG TPA: hypothetical protein VEL07_15840 [Planctomycetota bacterium]|nr:hypothetical protein [Planctomycetota bacterium]